VFAVTALLLLSSISACDGGTPWSQDGRTISKETFIETMVELRLGAAQTRELRLTRAQRERILERMDVTSDELLRFAEVHGGNVPFMAEVWDEINARLRAKAELEEDDLLDGPEELVQPPVRGPGS